MGWSVAWGEEVVRPLVVVVVIPIAAVIVGRVGMLGEAGGVQREALTNRMLVEIGDPYRSHEHDVFHPHFSLEWESTATG